jgi:LysR family cyn operon transcriptional activator
MVGTIRVGATHSFANHLVPQCVATFCDRNPELRVSIQELAQDEIVKKLEAGELDLGIAYRSDNQRQIWFKPLYTEELVLVVAKNHPMAKRKKVRMTELNNLRMTLFPSQYNTRRLIDECLDGANARPEVVVELNTVQPMLELIRRSELAGIVGALSVDVASGLAVIALENPTPTRTPGLLWKRGAPETPAIKQFAMVIMRAVESHKPPHPKRAEA